MSGIFIVSDWHLGHDNSWKIFKRGDDTPLRPFTSSEEMNETIIERHNKIVHESDKVYMLGDCVINKKFITLIKRFNGKLRLVRGNHDIYDDKLYYEAGFKAIYGSRVFDGMILTHIPIHKDSVGRFDVNVVGHLHCNYVEDPDYLCVSVEHTNYSPLAIEEVKQRIKAKKEYYKDVRYNGHIQYGYKNFIDGITNGVKI